MDTYNPMFSETIAAVTNAMMLFGIGATADTLAKPHIRVRYAHLLFHHRPNFVSEAAQAVIDLFSIIFETKCGRISIIRSILASVILFICLSFFVSSFANRELFDVLKGASRENLIGLVLVMLANMIGDYLSLLQTRFFMIRLIKTSRVVHLLGVLADALVTFLIIAGFIALFFWGLANLAGKPGWDGWKPIVWQVCHQANSMMIIFASTPQNYLDTCSVVMPSNSSQSGPPPNFEHIFNATALLTTFVTSAWLMVFFATQLCMGPLRFLFARFSRRITTYVHYERFPFSLTALFFALIYFGVELAI